MRLVTVTGPGRIEFNFMWAPGFIAFDNRFKMELEKSLGPELVGKDLTEELLDWAHEKVLDAICARHSVIEGLRDYLDAIKFVVEK